MRFIHAADIHLGRQFSGLSRSSPSLGKLFLRAGYSAWDRIVNRAIDLQVDFITLGGDTFDASNPSVRPRVAFRDGVARLRHAGIPVYAVLGNHDPLRTFPDLLRSLPGLFLFGPEPEAKEITQGAVIQGVSFENSAERANLARKIQRISGTELAIGLLHTNASGNANHGDYAPCTLDDLRAGGMDVWCLGHVHSPSVLSDAPLILYSGSAQGALAKENGPRGCYLVSVDVCEQASWEFLPTAPVRWENLRLDISDCGCPEDVLDKAEQACSELVSGVPDLDAIVVRISLLGKLSSNGLSDMTKDEEFRSLLSERLENLQVPVFPAELVDCGSLGKEPDLSLDGEGFLADLMRIADRYVKDPELRSELADRIHGELAKINRKYYEAMFDSEIWKQNPVLAEGHVNHAAELIARMFLEQRS
ncbi:MAG: DNA repair exonuclease [Desulfomonile tiedjei]|uniref:DNA repair exonuclease n=1 Tax=Desulfomonile tiedjei TaxID=2358 RepID=A0A9D6Z299_9BACT|nr:DNA repair exonuclease [Desulfomonile tiedjei]